MMSRKKTIRIKMKNGKSRLQKVQVLKSGKFKFIKNSTTGKRKSRTTQVRANKKTRKVIKTAKKRKAAKAVKKFITRDNVLRGAGSGFAGLGEAAINQITGGKITGNLATGIGGALLSRYTSGIPKKMGEGMLIKAIGDFTEENIAPLVLDSFNFGSSAAVGTTNTPGVQPRVFGQ